MLILLNTTCHQYKLPSWNLLAEDVKVTCDLKNAKEMLNFQFLYVVLVCRKRFTAADNLFIQKVQISNFKQSFSSFFLLKYCKEPQLIMLDLFLIFF